MHERRYSAAIERLRSPERVALLEIERVAGLALEGIHVKCVLDVGTGSGIFAERFAQNQLSVSGVDPNQEMLNAAKEFVPAGDFKQGTIEELPYKDKSFDLVFLGHVLHEADDLSKALAESKRCATQRVVILEWPYRQEENGPPLEHRLKSEDVLAAAAAVGFSRMETIQLQHMVLFRFAV